MNYAAAAGSILLALNLFGMQPEAGGPAQKGGGDGRDLLAPLHLIADWKPAEALDLVEAWQKDGVASADLSFVKAKALYFLSRYAEARAQLEKIDDAPAEVAAFLERLNALAGVTDRFVSRESEHFRLSVVPGKDEVLVGPGLDALEAAYKVIGDDIGVRPEQRIEVEVYPDMESFTLASTLSRDEVETSGTVALCKFNRLMIVSPRLLLRGYPWLDTLCHEYVHYVLWKRNGNTVPIWLHEGIAKYEERRWRAEAGHPLSPYLLAALKDSLAEDRLMPLDKMHPSFAKLDNHGEVVLASAMVLSLTRFVWDHGGYARLLEILDNLNRGMDYREAIAASWKMPFDAFMKDWRRHIETLEPPETGSVSMPSLRFKQQGDNAAKRASQEDDIVELPTPHAKDLARIASLLEERGRLRAAAKELAKARNEAGSGSPLLANRLASIYLQLNDHDLALQVLEQALNASRDYVTTWENLGALYRSLGSNDKAIAALNEAIMINPFNPYTRQELVELYSEQGLTIQQEREHAALKVLLAGK